MGARQRGRDRDEFSFILINKQYKIMHFVFGYFLLPVFTMALRPTVMTIRSASKHKAAHYTGVPIYLQVQGSCHVFTTTPHSSENVQNASTCFLFTLLQAQLKLRNTGSWFTPH